MTKAVFTMRAVFHLNQGSRVLYDPFGPTESIVGQDFIDKHRKKHGTIVDFVPEFVFPLDRDGRAPGMYTKSNCIKVRFDGEKEVYTLNTAHLVLLEPGIPPLPSMDSLLDSRRARSLPWEIAFYPGDIVIVLKDSSEVREIDDVIVNQEQSGLLYSLKETEEAFRARKEKDKKDWKEKRVLSTSFYLPQYTQESELRLKTPGNVRFLYTDPSKMTFPGPEALLQFWLQDGLSKQLDWHGSTEQAHKLIERGEADLLDPNLFPLGKEKERSVRRLLDTFDSYRNTVRAVSLKSIRSQRATT